MPNNYRVCLLPWQPQLLQWERGAAGDVLQDSAQFMGLLKFHPSLFLPLLASFFFAFLLFPPFFAVKPNFSSEPPKPVLPFKPQPCCSAKTNTGNCCSHETALSCSVQRIEKVASEGLKCLKGRKVSAEGHVSRCRDGEPVCTRRCLLCSPHRGCSSQSLGSSGVLNDFNIF